MHLKHELPIGKNAPESFHVVVEIPKGSTNKYEYDEDLGIFKLDRVLFSPLHYPGDYGFMPQTLGKDGDPLDGLVLVTNPTFPGIVIESRPIGVLEMVDNGDSDDKILCVPVDDIRFEEIQDLEDVQKHQLKEIAHFFEAYKHLEGKKVEIKGWHGKKRAMEIVEEAMEAYRKDH